LQNELLAFRQCSQTSLSQIAKDYVSTAASKTMTVRTESVAILISDTK